MEKYYRIEFTAILQKMTLAFKMQCDLQIFWKRGQKVAQTGKIPFRNCSAQFDKSKDKDLTISCNMVFNTAQKKFKEKQTKFAIVIYTEKGNKQAGQIVFDVAPFLNERNKQKAYQMGLEKCPDKKAFLAFILKANIIEEKALDTISQSSLVSVDIQNLTGNASGINPSNHSKDPPVSGGMKKLKRLDTLSSHNSQSSQNYQGHVIGSTTSIMLKKKQNNSSVVVPSRDKQPIQSRFKPPKDSRQHQTNDRSDASVLQKIKQLQKENAKIKEELKKKAVLEEQNQDLKRRLKDDDYEPCKDIKKKLDAGKKQIENLQKQLKGQKKLKQEIRKLQFDILKSKERLMTIFNDADRYGPQALDLIQRACGFKEY